VTRETWHVLLTLAGAGFEVAGLTWLVADASRARSAEFGEHGFLRRIWYWFAFWLGPPEQPVHLTMTAGGTVTATGTLTARQTNETEIERLQREVEELRDRVERYEGQTAQRFSALDESIRRAAEDLGGRLEDISVRQRELHRTALRRDVRGGRLFILGALLSAIANVV
jgi:hypothetical protein